MYRMNRLYNIYLCKEKEYQQLFVTFVLPSSGIILKIYYKLCGLWQMRSLDGMTNVAKYCKLV